MSDPYTTFCGVKRFREMFTARRRPEWEKMIQKITDAYDAGCREQDAAYRAGFLDAIDMCAAIEDAEMSLFDEE